MVWLTLHARIPPLRTKLGVHLRASHIVWVNDTSDTGVLARWLGLSLCNKRACNLLNFDPVSSWQDDFQISHSSGIGILSNA